MKKGINIFLGQYLVLCYISNSLAEAALGPNVRQAKEYEFPFVAFVTVAPDRYFDPLSPFFCTGSLFTQRDVLCSEHCLKGKTPEDIQVNVGSHDIRYTRIYYPEWWISYETWHVHKYQRFADSSQSLLTIIRLTENVTNAVHGYVSTVPRESLYGETVQIVTWGKTNSGSVPMVLEVAELQVLTKDECERRYTNLSREALGLPDALMCTAANPYVVTTDGDYGSPIIYNNRIVGVTKGPAPMVRHGFHENQINVHYSAGFYRDFLIDVINNFA